MHTNPPRRPSRRLTLVAALVALAGLALGLAGCGSDADASADGTLRVVATTNFIADAAQVIGGDAVEVTALMGPGVDPHLYKARAADVGTLREADLILYGGLELEGRLSDLLIEMASRTTTVAVSRDIPESALRTPSEFEGKFDPHIWFSVPLWKQAIETTADAYAEADPAGAAGYRERADAYLAELDELDAYVRGRITEIPERQRVLITSHDAFGYLGDEYALDVAAIQGTSTATEATTADIERIADLIVERDLNAVFIESSVPRQTIDAVLASADSKGQEATVGGELFGDSAGDPGTPEGTYLGMVRHNIDTIVEALR